MDKKDKIIITGAHGLVGKNLVEELNSQGYTNIIFTYKEKLDLRSREEVINFFKKESPDYVFHLAALIKGIKETSSKPVEFLRDNILINTNVIDACYGSSIKKLINLGSATIYSNPENPSKTEEDLFKGDLENGTEAYALSKICALKLCSYYNLEYDTEFITLVSPNIYGKYSLFDPERANVVGSLMSKLHHGKTNNQEIVEVWGSGNAVREFIYAKDLSKILIEAMQNLNKKETIQGLLNCGLGDEITIRELAETIKEVVGFEGKLKFDKTKPEGILRRVLDSSKISKVLVLPKKTPFKEGLKETYKFFLKSLEQNEKS